MLTNEERERFSRHILLNEVGEIGQNKLKKAKVLVIGAGGLGCPVLQYLTAAGIGTIGIIDFDKVDISNLQRQILFTSDDIGKNKAKTAFERLQKLNPLVNFIVFETQLTNQNALAIFNDFDIIVDGTDNFQTRYLVNDACVILKKPLIYGSIFKFEGQVSVFNFQNGPTYRCLFPTPPEKGTVPSCSEVGVLGVLPGIIGCYQANEVLKIILEIGEPLNGKLLIINTLTNANTILNFEKSNPIFELTKNQFEAFDYDFFCGLSKLKEITAEELKLHLLEGKQFNFVDVREPFEQPKLPVANLQNLPMSSIFQNLDKIDRITPTVVFCQHGIRSVAVLEELEDLGFKNLINLKGGIVKWAY